MSASTLNDLLAFIYTNEAPNMDQNASALLDAAERYYIPRLKYCCQLYLSYSLDTTNVIARLVEADIYSASYLKNSALHFIAANASEVCKTSSWKDLLRQQPHLASEAFERLANTKHHNESK